MYAFKVHQASDAALPMSRCSAFPVGSDSDRRVGSLSDAHVVFGSKRRLDGSKKWTRASAGTRRSWVGVQSEGAECGVDNKGEPRGALVSGARVRECVNWRARRVVVRARAKSTTVVVSVCLSV